MPLVISLIRRLSSLLVKALSRSLSAPNTCNCPQKITFVLHPNPLTSSYCLSSSYLPCSYSSSLVLPLNFLWNTLLKISLIFKWANLTSKPAASRRWVSVTTKNSFPYQWQRRKCFSLHDIKIPAWWHVPCRALSPWKGSFEYEGGWHISYLWGSSKGTSSLMKGIRLERQGREESSISWLWEQVSRQAAQSPACLEAGQSLAWLGLTSEFILLWAEAPDSPSNLNFPSTLWSHVLFYTIFLKMISDLQSIHITKEWEFSKGKASSKETLS